MSRQVPADRIVETKVVILGHTSVGKTSLVNRYIRGQFSLNTTATIGAAFMKKDMFIDGYQLVLQIWDTAGQERFRSMSPMYYRGAHAAVLVFDATSKSSFQQAIGWVDELKENASSDIRMVMASNKTDLRESVPDSDCVSVQEAATYAASINAEVFHTSAKTGEGIEKMFDHLGKQLLEAHLQRKRRQQDRDSMDDIYGQSSKVDLNDDNYKGGSGGGGGDGGGKRDSNKCC
eukprot:TRINITY_DN66504_c4_g2_i1.p1 TRINITY_DN66504_c4_g2~~TRINITY_DN66504_c4_g2_i1.p1  ORF type:complete len:240 (-),score=118.51 TRINITY_DN66504_c4_g2_i1:117-815(-)